VSEFPTTHHSVVAATRSDDADLRRRAFERLIAAYWRPVYKYVRLRWGATSDDAQDLTQEFFLRAMEKRFFDRYQPSQARFRTFLRVCLDRFVSNQRVAASRLKRGGGAGFIRLDVESAEAELRAPDLGQPPDVEAYFREEWVRSLFTRAVDELGRRLEASGRQLAFRLFSRYDLEGPDAAEPPTYAGLAREFHLHVTQVTNQLHAVRRQFREIVLEELRAITAGEDEFRAEARELFGPGVHDIPLR
jgi:RNA polymerase sigma factor (sigma-70 family)